MPATRRADSFRPSPGAPGPSFQQRNPHQLLKQSVQPIRERILFRNDPGMNRRRLNDRATWRDQPLEALSLRELCDWSSRLVAGTDTYYSARVLLHGFEVKHRPQHAQPSLVDVHLGLKQTLLQTKNDHADIQELLPLDAWDHAQHGVVKRRFGEHGSPPVRSLLLSPAGDSGTRSIVRGAARRAPGRKQSRHRGLGRESRAARQA